MSQKIRQGDIEALPLENSSVDVYSNCVINLAPDDEKYSGKLSVF